MTRSTKKRINIRRNQYYQAGIERLRDATVLYKNERYHAMVYLLGFVLECALAYSFCTKRNKEYIEDCEGYTEKVWLNHDNMIKKLYDTGLHDLEKDLSKFINLGRWKVTMRYEGDYFNNDKNKAKELYDMVVEMYKKIIRKSV